ncbi:MAG: ABC transporter substrate-binding protein [Candidatus Nanopelagicales bacterium]
MAKRSRRERAPKELQPFLSRRGFLKAAGVTGVAATTVGFSSALAGCSSSSADVVWSNWTLYMDVDDDGNFVTLNKFQEATGLTVEYNEDYNDNSEFWAEMLPLLESGAATGRDIVSPTDWMAARWISRGYAQELNKANMPNSGNLIAELQNPGFDPGRKFTMPWQSGYGGLGWNKAKLQEAMGITEMTTMDQLFDPRLAGQVVLLTEMRDTIGAVMAWQGADPANFTADQFYAAIDFLQSKVDDGHIQGFQGNDYAVGLENGDITAVIGWSGDLVQLGEDFGYANPETGGNLWTDNLLIPVGAENKENAEKLIDWYYQPDIAAELAAWVNYISPVAGAKEAAMEIDPELAENPLIFPTEADLAKTFIFKALTDAEEQEYDAAFQRLLGN